MVIYNATLMFFLAILSLDIKSSKLDHPREIIYFKAGSVMSHKTCYFGKLGLMVLRFASTLQLRPIFLSAILAKHHMH